MFIKIKGVGDEEFLVNTNQIKFVSVASKNSDTFLEFGEGRYIRSETSIAELEKMLIESEDTE